MIEFSHRDRRAHRDLNRAIETVLVVSVGLIALAMALPTEFIGILAVVGLAVLGVAYIGWSDRMLAQYASDLRHATDGSPTHGFVRAEVGGAVGLDREELPPSPSPHVRRRPRAGRTGERDEPLPSGSDPDQV